MNLPAGIQFGYVTGKFLAAVADGSDGDRFPDAVPLEVTSIVFTPAQGWVTYPTTAPPVVVTNIPVTCSIDDQGNLVDPQGNVGVYLIDGPYAVQVSLPGRAPTRLSITVPANGTVDLATYF